MSRTDPAPATREEQSKQIMKAFGKLVERITPWLVEVGGWIFGGLIAFTLLVMASLLTIGPVDPAIMVATTAFALALPLNVTGLILLRLIQDMKHIGFEEELTQAFQEVDFTVREQVVSPKALESWRKRRTGIVLGSSLGILALSLVLTLTGMTATLWHMAWWIGVAFIAMGIISQVSVIVAIVTSSQEEKEQKRRYREENTRQAKERSKKNKEKA